MSDAETRCLREYLLRGGYLVVDDFRGPEQWEIFRLTMDRVLPNRAIVDLAQSLYLDEVRGGMGWKTGRNDPRGRGHGSLKGRSTAVRASLGLTG